MSGFSESRCCGGRRRPRGRSGRSRQWPGSDGNAGELRAAEREGACRLDPASFTTRIDNPWWPMRPGSRWVYRKTAPDGTVQRVVVRVLSKTKRIANGVTTRVVRDVVTEDGKPRRDHRRLVRAGRLRKRLVPRRGDLGYENGKRVSTQGSFEAGVDRAQAGVIMPVRPGLECDTGRSTTRARPRIRRRS